MYSKMCLMTEIVNNLSCSSTHCNQVEHFLILALGLQCYSCRISGPTSLCDKVTNSSMTNCTGLLDACVTTAMTIKTKVGGIVKNVYTMACAEKVCVKQTYETKAKHQSVIKSASQPVSHQAKVSQSVS